MTSSDIGNVADDLTGHNLTQEQREEMLRRSWMANDGLWFYHTATTLGIDKANELNGEVVREFARQEMRRLMRSVGIDRVETIDQYLALMQLTRDIYLGSLMDYDDQIVDGTHDIDVRKCFAYLGVRRAGIDKVYRCGPGARVQGWLDAMGLQDGIQPEVGLCQMAHKGSCSYQIHTGLSAQSECTDAGSADA